MIEVRNPASGALLATVPSLGAAELEDLARRAREAQPQWAGARLRRARRGAPAHAALAA